jgi:hypothetical protein
VQLQLYAALSSLFLLAPRVSTVLSGLMPSSDSTLSYDSLRTGGQQARQHPPGLPGEPGEPPRAPAWAAGGICPAAAASWRQQQLAARG